jgi:hypothetical protein
METNLTIANTCASGFNNDYKSNPYPGKISVSDGRGKIGFLESNVLLNYKVKILMQKSIFIYR